MFCAYGYAVFALLPPPQLVTSASGRTELNVPISASLSITVLEADAAQQESLVDKALESSEPIGGAIDDPYGVVLWPAAQVVAHEISNLDLNGAHVLELGAGTGLCSLTALACGAARVHATDYREEPLELLIESAARNELLGGDDGVGVLSTAIFDIKADEEALPELDAHYVVAADLLYQQSTSIALAKRCVEALLSPTCRAVIVGDLGRPGRKAFLDALVAEGVREEAASFQAVEGWLPGAPRHELVSTSAAAAEPGQALKCSVGLLRLLPKDMLH